MNDSRQRPLSAGSGEPLRVIFVMGAGRSGSTVMDTLLGNHPGVVSVGELRNLHTQGWTEGLYCACGARATECDFWTRVLREWKARSPGADVAAYVALQKRYEDFGVAQWLRLLWQRRRPSASLQKYLEQTRSLYEAISAASGNRTVVDSSKRPKRAFLLSMIPELDLRIVHLVRDARGVVWSRKKATAKNEQAGVQQTKKARSAAYSAAFWTLVNVLSACVKRTSGAPVLTVRYEDFVRDPNTTLRQITFLSGIDFAELGKSVAAGAPMKLEHTVAGNRLRMSGSVTLRYDCEWTRALSRREQRVSWAIAGWLLKQYRYRRQVVDPSAEAPRPQPQRAA